jgi:hypothetical protein
MKILLGADPELFVQNIETGAFRSAHDLIPGSKDDPYIVRGGAVQVDGVAAEFNINPAHDEDEFELFISLVRNRIDEMVRESTNDTCRTVAIPTALFDQEYFDNLPEFPKMLGCTPDYNAYTGERNVPPQTDKPFRTGGGHIHIGWGSSFDPSDDDHLSSCCGLVRQLDAVLYPASHTWDSDMERRTLYGSRGSFRPKTYGVEYRPLSNAWLNSPDLIRRIYRDTYRATELYFEGVKLYDAE